MTDRNHQPIMSEDKSEQELTAELGRIEAYLYKLRNRREEILEELGETR